LINADGVDMPAINFVDRAKQHWKREAPQS